MFVDTFLTFFRYLDPNTDHESMIQRPIQYVNTDPIQTRITESGAMLYINSTVSIFYPYCTESTRCNIVQNKEEIL